MPISTTHLAANRMRTTLIFLGDPIEMEFKPGMLTKRFIAEMSNVPDGGDAIDTFGEALARLITWWDITDGDNGPMFPLDAKRIASELPLPLLRAITQHLTTVATVGEVNGATPSKLSPVTSA